MSSTCGVVGGGNGAAIFGGGGGAIYQRSERLATFRGTVTVRFRFGLFVKNQH
jgi:hypothetical protein